MSSPPLSQEYVDEHCVEVERMAQLGCTVKEIAYVLGISHNQVNKWFTRALEKGRGNLRLALRKSQIELAIHGKNCQMLIWLGKIYLDQREPKGDVENSGALNVSVTFYGQKAKVDYERNRVIDIEPDTDT